MQRRCCDRGNAVGFDPKIEKRSATGSSAEGGGKKTVGRGGGLKVFGREPQETFGRRLRLGHLVGSVGRVEPAWSSVFFRLWFGKGGDRKKGKREKERRSE